MRTVLGRIEGVATTVGAVLLILGIAHSASAADSAQFLRFASPTAVVNQATDANVSLASCCSETSCSTAVCGNASCEPACESCGGCCGTLGCSCSCGCGADGGLLDHFSGLLAPSDQCFNGFISPMTNPIFFEDPRTLTEARLIYLHHQVPQAALGGDVDLFALQLRAAVSERLSVIATKSGFATSSNPLIDDGWMDINIGLKYNLIRDPRRQWLYTIGATYEMPTGSSRTLQGNGDGTFHLFSTCAKRVYGWNWLLAHGIIIPADEDAESQWFYVSTHVSRKLAESNFYFLAEMNLYSWQNSGTNGIPGVEGLDVFNFGSTNVTGNDIVTGAFGLKYKPRSNVELGVAWENPLTDRRDILDNRLTLDCILRY